MNDDDEHGNPPPLAPIEQITQQLRIEQMFGGTPSYPQPSLVPEKQWIQQWQPKFDTSGDPAVVHNMHSAQAELKKYLDSSSTPEEALARFRADPRRGVPDSQIETVINSYQRGGVWWGTH